MDLIDRQAAIGRIEKKLEEVYGYAKTEYSEGYVNACHAAEKMLNSLPSAQPEIIYCSECKFAQYDLLSHMLWCEGRVVFSRHYCSLGKRREE